MCRRLGDVGRYQCDFEGLGRLERCFFPSLDCLQDRGDGVPVDADLVDSLDVLRIVSFCFLMTLTHGQLSYITFPLVDNQVCT